MIEMWRAALAIAVLVALPASAAPIKTDRGLVEGVPADGVVAYKGIPFAAPPVGDLRWKAPQPAPAWTGVRKTDAFAPACMQKADPIAVAAGQPKFPTSEDCLYLNVWTPATSASAKLPVMVRIHGGAFSTGATASPGQDGAALARKGVVVVTITYRLGAFGFLAHPELSAESGGKGSGTYGLMDMIAALQWVKRNAAAFGGDPHNVTIFGESAGGIAISMLAASPKAKKLFDKAICESGGNFAPPTAGGIGGESLPTLASAEAHGADLLRKLNVASVAEARRAPADQVLAASGSEMITFWPALDGNVLPGSSYELYVAGRYNDTPVLIGTNRDEGTMFVANATAEKFRTTVKANYGEKADAILSVYPTPTEDEALQSARQLFGDTTFAWPTWTWARLQSRTGKSKVFVYYWTFVSPGMASAPLPFRNWGAFHGSEVSYVFGNARGPWAAADRKMADLTEGYWVNFARTGDPNGPGLPLWPAFTAANPVVMKLDTDAAPIPVPNLDKLKVLDDYYAWRRSQLRGAP